MGKEREIAVRVDKKRGKGIHQTLYSISKNGRPSFAIRRMS